MPIGHVAIDDVMVGREGMVTPIRVVQAVVVEIPISSELLPSARLNMDWLADSPYPSLRQCDRKADFRSQQRLLTT